MLKYFMRRIAFLAWIMIIAATHTAYADTLGDLTSPFAHALEDGNYGWALLMVFIAGMATSLTPCVYPMIAITVSVFGARQAKTRVEGALLSGAFVLGIAALFTPIGILSALTGSAMGATQTNPWVMVPLALIFLAMAASMFGAFELALPASIQNRLAQVGGTGYRGAFLIGLVNGFIAAPCTGPVLTVLLSWVATSRNVVFGGTALFVYSLGLGLLFFLVGTFAVSLPKSGRWLDGVKSIFGIIMTVTAFHYLIRLIDLPIPLLRNDFWLIGSAIVVVFGILLGAIHLSFKYGTLQERIRKTLGVSLSVFGLLSLVLWFSALPEGAHIEWREDYVQAQHEAQQHHMPIIIDFSADWCGACQELEHQSMSDPRVVAEMQHFMTIRVDLSASKATPEKWALLRSYGQPGLPLVVFHHADGQEAARITGFVSADVFLQHVNQGR